MRWYVLDRNGRKWFPYVMAATDGSHDVLLHHELADTDMGDLFMGELAQMFGPVVVVSGV